MSFKTRVISLLLLMVMFISFAFSGCNIADISSFGMEDLMQPPMPDEEKYQIKLLLDTLKEGTVTFNSPKSGVFTTACTEYDIDGDGTDEAVAFYQEKANGLTTLYIHLFHKGANGWENVNRLPAGEDDIFLFDFYDLDDDKEDEIVVLWENTEYEQSGKTLAVYEYDKNNGNFLCATSKDCEDFTVVDLQNDKKLEVVTVTLKTENVFEPKAEVCQYSNGEFERLGDTVTLKGDVEDDGEIEIKGEIKSYVSVSSSGLVSINDGNGKEKEYFPRVMVDCYCESEDNLRPYVKTYMIYCEKEEIGSDKYKDEPKAFEYGSELSIRESTITSRDINNDGVIDLPVLEKFVNTKPDDTTGPIPDGTTEKQMVSWKTYDGTGWPISEYTVLNSDFNYILTIPEEWVGDIYFEDNSSEGEYIFKKWDENVENTEELELYIKVKVFKAVYWEASKGYWESEGYTKVDTNKAGTLVYAMCKGDFLKTYKVKLTINE